MSYNHSIVLIVAAEDRPMAEEAGRSLGYTDHEYTVALSPDGAEPATHYALHSWARQDFADLLTGRRDAGPDFTAVLAHLTVSVRASAAGHFQEALEAKGLQRITPPQAD
ncbi:hypothetical protein [Parvularcula maris]|uniref:Uncharacterized protein n=1 Tax=Parvularcula maris TaxID=2965077 RepID=A0A9X2L6N9_9PROT|nr:hypothetical protein [Parvularcula maris]MCQ8184060.1 hypothetical protein [Parvularcula maris]